MHCRRFLRRSCTRILARRLAVGALALLTVLLTSLTATTASANTRILPIGETAYDTLVLRARAGDTEPALAFFRQRGEAASRDELIDYILIASWAGHSEEVIAAYETLRKHDLAISAAPPPGTGATGGCAGFS